MTEVIQIDTFSRLVAEKDGEILYLKYVTSFVSSASEKPEIIVLFNKNYIYHFVRPVPSKTPSYCLQFINLRFLLKVLVLISPPCLTVY